MNQSNRSPFTLRLLAFLAILFLLTGLLVLAAPTQAAPPAQSPDTKPSVSGGQLQWGDNCQPCHGPTGQGDGPTASQIPDPLPDFTNPENARQYKPTDVFDVIKNGRIDKMMPPWGNQLSDAQIWDAAAYVWRLSTSVDELAAGEAIYTEQCAACHGQDGLGDGPQASAPMTSFADLPVMMERSLADLQVGYDSATDPHAGLNLSEDELWASLNYIRTFSFAVPQRNGVLTGQVVNASTGQPAANVPVTLYAYVGNSPIEEMSTTADESGNFTFKHLATDHTTMYVAETIYDGIIYISSEPGMFVPDSAETSLNVEVYNTTTDPSHLNITQLHYLVSFSPNALNVLQIFIVGNTGNATYVGQDGQTFAFDLPASATNVAFQDNQNGQRFIETGTGYVDTEPIVPGEEGLTIAAQYDLPFFDDSMTLDLPIPMDVTAANVLMIDQGALLESDQLGAPQKSEFQGNSFLIYDGGNLKAGDTLSLRVTNLDDLTFEPSESVPTSAAVATAPMDHNLILWVILAIGVVAVVTVTVVYPKARPQLTHQVNLNDDTSDTRRQKLLLLLARLDEAHANGELGDEVYRRARAKYKAELADLMGVI